MPTHELRSGPIVNTRPIGISRRRYATGDYSAQLSELGKLRAWMDRMHGYVPAAWARHHLGLSRNAITFAVYRGWVREEEFRCADGTIIGLVSIQDVARIGPRRHRRVVLLHPAEPVGFARPAPAKRSVSAARTRPAKPRGRPRRGRQSSARRTRQKRS